MPNTVKKNIKFFTILFKAKCKDFFFKSKNNNKWLEKSSMIPGGYFTPTEKILYRVSHSQQ